ncbi:glycosyltransferase [Frigidibacter albus]|uniref:Glycosyltransferase n=1 Tax=Frigidibacter albus TaxID=1465486 RepID=A0A6L8VJV0_9RHOB|nr:glycosyltransferase family 4 protein [Frigidibacter albus]MZQ89460.1 glycosyltransferase [Frigidibacter albus]NBE31366.1 glycosyltransferase [Frigidibacter albus]GGH54257.1 hypothetical protein GCM10011341_20590 [Frigidibacter albus]
MTAPGRPGPGVVFVVPSFHTNLFFATRALVQAGIRVQVFSLWEGRHTPHSFVTPRCFGAAPGWRDLSRALEAAAPDLIFVREAGALSRRAALLARLKGLAMIGYDQRPISRRSRPQDLLERAVQGRALRRVTPVRRAGPALRADPWGLFLPLPVGTLAPQPPRLPAAQLRVLAVGKLAQPRKRILQLIEELMPAGQAGRITLTVVGSTTLDASNAEAAVLERVRGLQAQMDWLQVLENLPFAAMPALYASHDACVLPSTGEPLGSAPLEGMAYGAVPVISVGAGSAGMIREGENGLVVNVRQPGQIAAAIDRLAADRALLARLSAGALDTVAGDLSEAAYVASVSALIASRGKRIG